LSCYAVSPRAPCMAGLCGHILHHAQVTCHGTVLRAMIDAPPRLASRSTVSHDCRWGWTGGPGWDRVRPSEVSSMNTCRGGRSMPHYMYVSLQDEDKIRVFALDAATGHLTPQSEAPVAGAPSPLAISPDRKVLYVGQRN